MTIGGFSAYNTAMSNNAAFSGMQGKQALTNLLNSAGDENINPADLLKQELDIRLRMLQDELIYKASEAQKEAQEKLEKENIEESFNTFG